MKTGLIFRKTYAALAAILLLTEIFIAVYVRDGFVRPYLGDLLVVILLYCFFRSFFSVEPAPAILSVFAFACLVELLQYFQLVRHLGLQQSTLARVIVGSSSSWLDLLAYAVGAGCILAAEEYVGAQRNSLSSKKP